MIRAISFLQRDRRTGILHFRRRIPERYRRSFGGRSEIKRSLRTCDKKIAAPRAMALYAELQAIFNELDKVIDVVDDNSFKKIEFNETIHPDGRVERKADIDFDGDSEKELAALAQMQEIFMSTPKDSAASQQPAAKPLPKVEEDALVDSVKLSVVCRKYREDMIRGDRWTSKTAAEHEATHDLLIQYFRDKPIVNITPPKARQFKEVLMQLPPNMTKGRYADKTIRQIIQMKPETKLSPRTINGNYLQRYSSLFTWAHRNNYCHRNPFEGLKIPLKKKAINDKNPFAAEDILTLFNATRFNRGKLKPWQYFVPLIALFSGARQQEIAQLRVQDIIEEDGIGGMQFTGYEDVKDANGRLKTASSDRVIPVHSVLIKHGLIKYADEMREEGQDKLFPELFNTKAIKAGEKVGRWFNRTYMKQCGLFETAKERRISFHSFRHNFTDCLKKGYVPESIAAQICGRVHDSITFSTYGSEYSLKEMHNVMEQHVHFDLNG